jgi:NAD(P)-dependent dehydrogenase (short-subunit alcohol dehydrogenase family)
MELDLKGRVAIVTGAAGGIGTAIARDMAKEGVKLALSYHNKECSGLVDELKTNNCDVVAIKADVSNWSDVQIVVQAAYERFGRIDILVNNAGIGLRGTVEDTKEEEWDRIMAVNLKSVFLLSKAVMKYMKQQGGGRIINIGSVVAKTSTNAKPWVDLQSSEKTGGGAYAASKAGVHAITKTLAKELAPFGITVNCIAPGPIQTPMTPVLPDPMKDQMPVGRIGYPEEVSAFVVLLASSRGAFATGEIIDVNGGLWMD